MRNQRESEVAILWSRSAAVVLAAAWVVLCVQAVAPRVSWADACCLDRECREISETLCFNAGGEFLGTSTTCDGIVCTNGEPLFREYDPADPPAILTDPPVREICLDPYTDPDTAPGATVVTWWKVHDQSPDPDPAREIRLTKSGDFAQIRWVGGDCTFQFSACCMPDGTCQEVENETACTDLGGFYQGDGSDCDTSVCGGACCDNTAECIIVGDESLCNWQYLGDGTDCADVLCGGACCQIDTSCIQVPDASFCDWEYQGDGVACIDVDCGYRGACCKRDQSCEDVADLLGCLALGGVHQGPGTECATTTCEAFIGACCYANGDCGDLVREPACEAAGGSFIGPNTTCDHVWCPPPNTGACCVDSVFQCVEGFDEPNCQFGWGGRFMGVGTRCRDVDCDWVAPCCVDLNVCEDLTEGDCLAAGGTYWGPGGACAQGGIFCYGPCCLPDGTCEDMGGIVQCLLAQGTWLAVGVTCDQSECPPIPMGACCLDPYPTCENTTQAECFERGGFWFGERNCASLDCPFG